jgi:hypothetical protein
VQSNSQRQVVASGNRVGMKVRAVVPSL